jgi:hypothetical protein
VSIKNDFKVLCKLVVERRRTVNDCDASLVEFDGHQGSFLVSTPFPVVQASGADTIMGHLHTISTPLLLISTTTSVLNSRLSVGRVNSIR